MVRRIVPALALLLTAVFPAPAQTNFVLHNFGIARFKGGVSGYYTNSDGMNPSGGLIMVGTNIFGTASYGGTNGSGTVFAFNTNGGFSVLYTFPSNYVGFGNALGANPNDGLVFSNGILYGTTLNGGVNDQGAIFSISTNGSGIQNLHSFSDNSTGFNTDGANPFAGVVVAGTNLFGTAADGGSGGNGVVFALNLVTKNLSVLHNFSVEKTNFFGTYTNSDGANPKGGLVLSGSTLYGTTAAGGTNGYGTVFAIGTNGNNFTVIHYFDVNGANPQSGLVLSGQTLFGIGGSVVYALNTNGGGYTVLKQFGSAVDSATYSASGLTISNGTLYGVAAGGGAYGYGQIFALNTNGAGFADFHDFTPPANAYTPNYTNFDGISPGGGVVQLNSALYGAASQGGNNGNPTNNCGLLFMVSPPHAVVSSQLSNKTNFSLSFPILSGMSYTVQQSTNLMGTNWVTFTNILGSTLSTQFTVIATNKALFFRVRQP